MDRSTHAHVIRPDRERDETRIEVDGPVELAPAGLAEILRRSRRKPGRHLPDVADGCPGAGGQNQARVTARERAASNEDVQHAPGVTRPRCPPAGVTQQGIGQVEPEARRDGVAQRHQHVLAVRVSGDEGDIGGGACPIVIGGRDLPVPRPGDRRRPGERVVGPTGGG